MLTHHKRVYSSETHALISHLTCHNNPDNTKTKTALQAGGADLHDVLVQVGEGAGYNPTVAVAPGPSSDGECFPTIRLAVGKDGSVVAGQYSDTEEHTH